MKVVVTGATGCVGLRLVKHLAGAGWSVVAVQHSEPAARRASSEPRDVRALTADLASDACVPVLRAELGPDVALVHLAAAWPALPEGPRAAERTRLLETNTLGTMRVLDAARQAGAKLVVYASTLAVYAAAPDATPLTEDSATEPLLDHAVSKLGGEDHVRVFSLEERVPAITLRFAAIYGAGSRSAGVFPGYLAAVARGRRPRVAGDGHARLDQLHAADAVASIERALGAERSGVYNVSDGEARSLLELARSALEVGGQPGEPEFASSAGPRTDLHVSNERIRRELGFAPSMALLAGAREHLDWLKSGAGSLP